MTQIINLLDLLNTFANFQTECAADKFYNKGPFTVMCLLKESYSDDENLRDNASYELTEITRFWIIVLLLLLVVGWAHFGEYRTVELREIEHLYVLIFIPTGYFNVFCPCSFCFPEDGYEEVKRYLVLNPPGLTVRRIVPKANVNATTVFEKETYKPSETEIYLYNNLWQTVYNV